jgi:hypothetical protein
MSKPDFMHRQLQRLDQAIELLSLYEAMRAYEPEIPRAPKKRKKPRSKPYRNGFKRLR